MVKTGSAYWAILLAGTALLSIVWAGTSEVTVILALLAGYFFGISSPESKMNAEFAKHLNKSTLYSRGYVPGNNFDKMKRYNENYDPSSAMRELNPDFYEIMDKVDSPLKKQEEE